MQIRIPGKDDDDSESPCPPIGSFDRRIIDSLSAQIAILDKSGIIRETNRAWREFGMENDFPGDAGARGLNYLAVCDQAAGKGAAGKGQAGAGGAGGLERAPACHAGYRQNEGDALE